MTDTTPAFHWKYEQVMAYLKKSQRTIQLYVKAGKLKTVTDPETREKLFNEEQVRALARSEGVIGKPKGHAITVQQLGQARAALVLAEHQIQRLEIERDGLMSEKDALLKEQGDLKEVRGRLETENKHLEKTKTHIETELRGVQEKLTTTTKRLSRFEMSFFIVGLIVLVFVGGLLVVRLLPDLAQFSLTR